MKQTIKLSLVSFTLLSTLSANETVILEPLKITSTVIKTDELQATSAVEVYTSVDIEKANVQDIYEFLNKNTSVTSMSSYGNPFVQIIDIHGYSLSNGNQNIVITLNGRKLNNIDNAPQLLSSIPSSAIDKIEIIKSSGIVQGGDGANAGVINITTKKSDYREIAFSLGTYGNAKGSFYVGHVGDKLSLTLSGEAQKNDGIRDINANGDKDKNKFSNANFELSYQVSEDLALRLGAGYTRADINYAGYLTKAKYEDDVTQVAAFSSHQTFDTNVANTGLTYYVNDNLTLNADVANEKKQSDYVPSSGVSDYTYKTAKVTLDYVSDDFSISSGVDGFYGDRVQNDKEMQKDNVAMFAMLEYYAGRSTFKAGYRYEKVSYNYRDTTKDIDDTLSLSGYELAYNYALDKQSSFFINYNHSYQAPVIDTFFVTDYANWPIVRTDFNGFIDPMTADNYTIGYTSINAKNKLKVSLYYVSLKNEIYLHKPDFKNTNIDKSHKFGLDFYDKFIIDSEYNAVLNYNYTQAIIDDEKEGTDDYSGKKLPGVSNHSMKLSINHTPNKHTSYSLSHTYRSEAYAADDFNNNFSQKQEAFNSTDISANYTQDNWEVFAKINNLFNKKNGLWIQDDAIYPTTFARTALVGAKLKF